MPTLPDELLCVLACDDPLPASVLPSFEGLPVFKNFEIDMNSGDIVYITGGSGSGKSTRLRMLSQKISESKEFG